MHHSIPIDTLGPQGPAMAEAVDNCVHCGFCLAVCPTYKVLGEEMAGRSTGMMLLATFAGLALLLAGIGTYGVLSYFVSQHTSEIGVRMAMGAGRGAIVKMILKRGMSLALLGVGIGLAGAFALTRLMASLLYEVKASDPITFAGVALLLAIIAALSCYIPARRAARVDPMAAIRYE